MYNLLFVDDDPWILEGMKEIVNWNLLSFNPPFVAGNVEEAKAIFRNVSVHILITDIEMIGNSGFDLLSWVNSAYPGTLSAFLTCHARFDFAQQAINLGVFGYLLKPLQEQALTDILKKCLQRLDSNHEGNAPEADKPHYSETIEKAIEFIQKNLGSPLTRES
ncbi:MAG: response regulator, partial [Lachnospiraceae bacterium]|nr:response regulator [Lachnospiraceae bacterium]